MEFRPNPRHRQSGPLRAGDVSGGKRALVKVVRDYPLSYYMLQAYSRLFDQNEEEARAVLSESLAQEPAGRFVIDDEEIFHAIGFERAIELLRQGESESPTGRKLFFIPVLNEERRRAILDLLNHHGRVLVTDLARQFETSQVTIRKDLEILHAHGLVHRTHGGALPSREGALEDPTLREKEKLHHQEKLRIAESAVEKVKEGQVLILDSGTTTTAIARALRNFQNLTIITNAVNIAAELAGTAVEVILTGGTLRKNSFSLVGPIAEETLRRLSADLLFLGVDGFDVHFGLSTPNLLEAKVNRVMDGDRLRLQQIRPAKLVVNRATVGVARSHHGPWHPKVRSSHVEASRDRNHAGVTQTSCHALTSLLPAN